MTCKHCGKSTNSLVVYKLDDTNCEMWCWDCVNEVKYAGTNHAHSVIGDDIPGGLAIKHGICNPDGTPKLYYSKKAIRDAAYNSGYFQGEDTPHTNPRIQEQRAIEREARGVTK